MSPANSKVPLVVDLDGSLLKTDLPFESFVFVMKNKPFKLLQILFQTFFIKTFTTQAISLKKQLAHHATGLSLKDMPWSQGFLNYLYKEKLTGRTLVLCTGSTQEYANQVQNLFKLFDHTWGSTLHYNMTGKNKALFLLNKYGKFNFDYAGNSLTDLAVARFARRFILVNPSFGLQVLSSKMAVSQKFNDKKISFISLIHFIGFSFCLLNKGIFILLFYFPSFSDFFKIMLIATCFDCLAIAGSLFFNSLNAQEDRTSHKINLKAQVTNLIATGDMSFQANWSWSGFFLLGYLGLLVYLKTSLIENIVLTFLYLFCVYWLISPNTGWLGRRKMLYTILLGLIMGTVTLVFSLKILYNL